MNRGTHFNGQQYSSMHFGTLGEGLFLLGCHVVRHEVLWTYDMRCYSRTTWGCIVVRHDIWRCLACLSYAFFLYQNECAVNGCDCAVNVYEYLWTLSHVVSFQKKTKISGANRLRPDISDEWCSLGNIMKAVLMIHHKDVQEAVIPCSARLRKVAQQAATLFFRACLKIFLYSCLYGLAAEVALENSSVWAK